MGHHCWASAGHPREPSDSRPQASRKSGREQRILSAEYSVRQKRPMISEFFIERPIFANVIAIITIIIGLVCFYALPVAQYPAIVPPTIQVSARYPGASAEVVAATVGIPIEQAVNGVENSLYISSTSASDGSYA